MPAELSFSSRLVAVIDAGNSRIKWAICDAVASPVDGAFQYGAVPTSDPAALINASPCWPVVEKLVLCCVAGEKTASQIEGLLMPLLPSAVRIVRFRSQGELCGVRNTYEVPSRLGADRFASLIGAWYRLQTHCLVVCAGTATTIDTLLVEEGHAVFYGGNILPGLDLMAGSLADNTADLPVAHGSWQMYPRNTDDAIVSGCMNAQIGAIERLYNALPCGTPCLTTGGNAGRLIPYLNFPTQFVETLVLQGLLVFALSEGGEGNAWVSSCSMLKKA